MSTTTISSSRFVGLYASIIRTKFQVVYTYPFVTNIELVGDTDMFMKLRNIKQKYESIPKEQDKQKFLDKNLNTLILNNYLHYSIEDFVSFYKQKRRKILKLDSHKECLSDRKFQRSHYSKKQLTLRIYIQI